MQKEPDFYFFHQRFVLETLMKSVFRTVKFFWLDFNLIDQSKFFGNLWNVNIFQKQRNAPGKNYWNKDNYKPFLNSILITSIKNSEKKYENIFSSVVLGMSCFLVGSFFIFLNFMKTRPNMRKATLERFARDIRVHKFKNYTGKMT